MHFTLLALAAFAVVTYARPTEDSSEVAVHPPVHQNYARAAQRFVAPEASNDPRYIEYALDHHNKHRENFTFNGVPTTPMKWNATTVRGAKKIADLCIFAHKMDVDGGGYGQNLAAGYSVANISGTVTDLWFNSEVAAYANYYGQAQPSYDNFGAWGHFSQLVWKDSTSLGCWTTDCSSKGGIKNVGPNVPPYLTVCNYYPAGNFGGQYAKNVGRPQGANRLNWDWVKEW